MLNPTVSCHPKPYYQERRLRLTWLGRVALARSKMGSSSWSHLGSFRTNVQGHQLRQAVCRQNIKLQMNAQRLPRPLANPPAPTPLLLPSNRLNYLLVSDFKGKVLGTGASEE